MNNMRLGIFAPYNRGETTAMAIRLAFTALRSGWTVKWLAPCRDDGVHTYWDKAVRVATRGRLPDWAHTTDCRVWFSVDASAFRLTQSAARVKHHNDILVPPWHSMTGYDHRVIGGFGSIVCPNSLMLRALETAFGRQDALRVCNWHSGLKPVLRTGFIDHRKPRASVVADRYTCRRHANDAMLAVARLLTELPTLHVAMVLDIAPDRREYTTARMLADGFGSRVTIDTRVSTETLLSRVYEADWLIDCSLRHDSGLLAMQAQTMGVPTVTWRVNPMDGVVCDDLVRGRDGVLVDCEHTTSICQAETAEWDTEALVAACLDNLPDAHKLLCNQTYCFRRADSTHDDIFRSFWQTALEHVKV